MRIDVVPYRTEWPVLFEQVAADLRQALHGVGSASVEHVGSTSVPGLAAKPILDVDIIVETEDVSAAVAALGTIGYVHRGDLGVAGREAFHAPDKEPCRNVYVCESGTLNVRNHLAVRDVLRRHDGLREEYAAVKVTLAADPDMDIASYITGKSHVLQKVLSESDLITDDERLQIQALNDPSLRS